MYNLILTKDGRSLGMTEAPTYIKQAENGCYVLCQEPEASGIVFDSVIYHLLDREPLDGAETVVLVKVDAGQALTQTQAALSDADMLNVDQEYRLTLLGLGIQEADLTI